MIVAIVQARMSSRRLPGKILAPLGGEPMILRQLERTQRAHIDRVVVATSRDASDLPLRAALDRAGAAYACGSLDDVLDRVYRVAVDQGARHVVRLTADCPLTDHRIIDRVVAEHLEQGNDYTSNTLRRSYPDGLDVEVASVAALERAWRECRDASQREHVMPYLYAEPGRFRLGNVAQEVDRSYYRLTVDYPEDLEVVRCVFDELRPIRPDFSSAAMISLLDRRPDLVEMNAMHNALLRERRERGSEQ
ncbi:MAG TPA: glycosyltransferase family protein [Gammaproteobacteria bacterium]|nr:glycosyltransferase family protein [Gammaproteobacteria bacterium]